VTILDRPSAIGPDGATSVGPQSPRTQPRDVLGTALPMSVVLGLLCVETGGFLSLTANSLDTRSYLIAHLGLCAAVAILGLRWSWASPTVEEARDKTTTVVQLVVWTILGGPFGVAIAAMLLVPQRSQVERAATASGVGAPSDGHSELTRPELLHGLLLDRRLRIEHAHLIRPLLDVILDGTQIEKLDALGIVSKRYTPAFAPALRRALEDKDGAVRVLAATVLAQQHNGYTKRIGAIQAMVKETSEHAKHYSELAQAHLEYAQSGLLDTSRANAEMMQARANLACGERIMAQDLPPRGSDHQT